jgi:antitoxin component YwqK of YwqJK toxin-antitoxin module
MSKVNYVDGKKQGESMTYYSSGEVKKKGNYVDGKLQENIFGILKVERFKRNQNG